MSQSICACTAVAGNYFAFARVLADSFHRFHPSIPLYILLADPPAHGAAPMGEQEHLVSPSGMVETPRL